jgi:lipopolysaccharide transport system permease protein
MISAQDSRRLVWRPLWELPGRAELIRSLARRELAARYRGSALGVVWAMLTPAVMISIYTFIFAGIFGARFGGSGTAWDYALYLFCALLPWTAFQDSLQVSANVIVTHANLVKRVVFPLEALPVAQVLAALATQMLGTLVLVAGVVVIRRELHASLVWLPALVLPQVVLMLGASWLVASLGVFLRDTGQVLGLLLVAWMFLTPIIYPEGIVPARYQAFINANPFTPLVRNYRRIILEGASPDWGGLAYFTVFALIVFVCGYWWFAKTRKNFADVI